MKCARCGTLASDQVQVFKVRAEQLCQDCLVKYVVGKVTKRLEGHKLRGVYGESARRLLVPLSSGTSSLSLLHILHADRAERLRANRPVGYDIYLVHVDESYITGATDARIWAADVAEAFPDYKFAALGIDGRAQCEKDNMVGGDGNVREDLDDEIKNCKSATDLEDLKKSKRALRIISHALENNCSSILYGNTSTHIAELVLTLTAKGLGGSVPVAITDGVLETGIHRCYPMRDLLRNEVDKYCDLARDPSLQDLLARRPGRAEEIVRARDGTIDALMKRYCSSVESGYPGVITNVIRTAEKLETPEG